MELLKKPSLITGEGPVLAVFRNAFSSCGTPDLASRVWSESTVLKNKRAVLN